MGHEVQIGGKLYELREPSGALIAVRRWNDGLEPRVPEFRPGDGYNKPRKRKITTGVWHWTGGEGRALAMAETLRKRKLGIEFAIDRDVDGTIYQFCDPAEVDTADAGVLNPSSFGVEIVCYGFSGQFTFDPLRALRVPIVPKLGRDRETYVDTVHGRKVRTAKFYPQQMVSALALADVTSFALGIPRRTPPRACTRAMDLGVLRTFSGHLGHYHITDRKRDPGTWFMNELADHFDAAGVA